jgi:hypothetical protein
MSSLPSPAPSWRGQRAWTHPQVLTIAPPVGSIQAADLTMAWDQPAETAWLSLCLINRSSILLNCSGGILWISRIEQVLLPLWRLPGTSPMTALVELYVCGAQPIVQQADTLLTAWQEATFREPTADDIAFEQCRLETPAEEAAAIWRFNEARHWETQPERRKLWNELMTAWSRLSVVSSVMTAAVTGDVEY